MSISDNFVALGGGCQAVWDAEGGALGGLRSLCLGLLGAQSSGKCDQLGRETRGW